MPAAAASVADAADCAALLDQSLDVGPQNKAEVRVLPGLLGQEGEETLLGHDQDVGKAGVEPAEVEGNEGPILGQEGRPEPLDVGKLEQRLSQADLVEDF